MKTMTQREIAARDAVLIACDALVRNELGKCWTLDAHMQRKREMLDIVDGYTASDEVAR
jgi:hypothetical protein